MGTRLDLPAEKRKRVSALQEGCGRGSLTNDSDCDHSKCSVWSWHLPRSSGRSFFHLLPCSCSSSVQNPLGSPRHNPQSGEPSCAWVEAGLSEASDAASACFSHLQHIPPCGHALLTGRGKLRGSQHCRPDAAALRQPLSSRDGPIGVSLCCGRLSVVSDGLNRSRKKWKGERRSKGG